MRKNLKEERIGLEFTTNEGYQVIIIDYVTREKIQIMFLDEHKWTTLKQIQFTTIFHKQVKIQEYQKVVFIKCVEESKKLRAENILNM